MRGWISAVAISSMMLVASSAAADEPKKTTADDEIEQSKAALAESQAQTAPPLERGTPYKPSVMPWVLGGVGIAGIITGGVFVLISFSDESKRDDFEGLAAIRTNANEKNDLLSQAKKSDDSAKTNLTIGAIAGGAGVALLGVGIVWAILDKPPKTNEPAQARARVRPFLGPESAGGTLTYAF